MCPPGKLRLALLTAALIFSCARPLPLTAQSSATESQVKAAYLLNFGKFVTWPATAVPVRLDAFSICVLGEDPFGPVLDATARGEKIDERPVTARRIRNAEEATDCQVLYIARSEQGQSRKIISALSKSRVLTVSDMPNFIAQGGIIQFTMSGNRVRFEVNLDAAQASGLILSSELLKVASVVHGKTNSRRQ
jgi:hypothetical protein